MAAIKTVHEAFLHELSDTYDAESQISKALPELVSKAQNAQVKQGLQEHLAETEQQIKNLEQVFTSLGEKPKKVNCKGMAGILSENTSTLKEIEQKALIDGAIVGGGSKVEHYEIASYRGLVEKARLMGHKEAQRLLKQNLQQEEQMAQRLEQLEKQLGQELVQQGAQIIGHAVSGSVASAAH